MIKISKWPLIRWHYVGDIYQQGKLVTTEIADGPWTTNPQIFIPLKEGYFLLDGNPCLGTDRPNQRYYYYAMYLTEEEVAILKNTLWLNSWCEYHEESEISTDWFHIYECDNNLERLLCLKSNNFPNKPKEFKKLIL